MGGGFGFKFGGGDTGGRPSIISGSWGDSAAKGIAQEVKDRRLGEDPPNRTWTRAGVWAVIGVGALGVVAWMIWAFLPK
jgi:hypothetical protein